MGRWIRGFGKVLTEAGVDSQSQGDHSLPGALEADRLNGELSSFYFEQTSQLKNEPGDHSAFRSDVARPGCK